MKKIITLGMTMAFLAGLSANAITVNVTAIAGYSQTAPTDGGEFNISPVIGGGYSPKVIVNGGFETFCMDRNGTIVVPGTYNATINTSGTSLIGNTLTTGSAWLYQQFAAGTLAGYNYTPGVNRAAFATVLQQALWNLGNGQYGGPAGTLNNVFVNAAVANFGSIAGATAFTTGNAFDVAILNLSHLAADGRTVIQDQPMFTLLPDGGTTLMLMGFGFSSLALISRKMRA